MPVYYAQGMHRLDRSRQNHALVRSVVSLIYDNNFCKSKWHIKLNLLGTEHCIHSKDTYSPRHKVIWRATWMVVLYTRWTIRLPPWTFSSCRPYGEARASFLSCPVVCIVRLTNRRTKEHICLTQNLKNPWCNKVSWNSSTLAPMELWYSFQYAPRALR